MANEKLGRYEILSELGQGAMGVVYKAIDPLIERTVAIKTIKLDLSTDELANFEERFYCEAKSAGRLNHLNIVTIYDVGKSGNIAYMAMEFLEGSLLKEVLDAQTAFSIEKIVHIAVQIANGLAYAHENGVVHRDIKPANIMLTRVGVTKIMDFGIAQIPAGARTLAGTVLGSPKYMAPEQIIGKSVDGRADLFALGVILYEMLTGESPFDGDNINTIMYHILNDTPILPSVLAPRTPAIFDYIISKALAKDVNERYQSAKALAHDLRNYKKLPTADVSSVAEPAPTIVNSRSRPKPSTGAETVVMPAMRPDSANPNASAHNPFIWYSRKNLIIVFAVLLSVLVITMILGKKSLHKNNMQPSPQKVKLTTPIIAKATENKATPILSGSNAVVVVEKTSPITSAALSEMSPKGEALLEFRVSPWGEIYIDGQKMGVSPPLKKLTVSAGEHKIEIRNLDFTPYSETVIVKAHSTKKIKYIFN